MILHEIRVWVCYKESCSCCNKKTWEGLTDVEVNKLQPVLDRVNNFITQNYSPKYFKIDTVSVSNSIINSNDLEKCIKEIFPMISDEVVRTLVN